MSLFGRFKKSKNSSVSLGIDIGTVSIKVAEVTNVQGARTLTNYAMLELADRSNTLNNALQSSSLHPLSDDLYAYLVEIRNKAQFKTLAANLALPAFIAQTALIDVPTSSTSDRALEAAAMAAASAYLPLPMTETTIRWVHVGEVMHPDGVKHQKILFMAIPTDRVNEYTNVAKKAGFTIKDIELESISIARAVTLATKEPTLIIDIGGRSSTCTVAKNGVVYTLTQTDFSSDSATQTVAQALAISVGRAEALKRQSTIATTAGGHELSTIVAPVIGAILSEAGRAMNSFTTATGEQVTNVVLCGAGSQLKGIEQYVIDQLKLPTTHATALGTTVAYPPELTTILPELNATLTVALGLAIKDLM